MLCAAIDIGSNTTRVLVAEPMDGQMKKVMEQRAYTRINKALGKKGEILPDKVEEVGEVVATQVRLAQEPVPRRSAPSPPPPCARPPTGSRSPRRSARRLGSGSTC